eukprot:scaffold3036_cov414-Prasinococcus_capsulatus_cf.AAC.12
MAGTEAGIIESSGGLGQFLLVMNIVFIVGGVACALVLALEAARFLRQFLPSSLVGPNGFLNAISMSYGNQDKFK